MAWDCATGTGQAARSLAPLFKKIIATDVSVQQIASDTAPQNVAFAVSPAEKSALDADSVDLITVAQAVHWFVESTSADPTMPSPSCLPIALMKQELHIQMGQVCGYLNSRLLPPSAAAENQLDALF